LTVKEEGKTIEPAFSTVMDITPTPLDLASVKHPSPTYKGREVVPVRGQSWAPYLTNRATAASMHAEDTVTGWEIFGPQALRKGNWKAVFIQKPYGPERWQLFNLNKDPGEVTDLSTENPSKRDELLLAWDEYVKKVGVAGATPQYGVLSVDANTSTPASR
jgi:arylsulfatase